MDSLDKLIAHLEVTQSDLLTAESALEAADDFLSTHWATRPIDSPDPTPVINQIRSALGRPLIIDFLKAV